MTITPTPAQFQAIAQQPADRPIVMVNLLKYRDRAAYSPDRAEAGEGLSGREAYRRYGAVALKHVIAAGGRVVFAGDARFAAVGTADWDEVVLVLYPSPAAFLKMTGDPDYQAAHYHREAGLARTDLICCDAGSAA